MRFNRIIAVFLLVVMTFAMAVCAAEVAPSIEKKDGPELVITENENGEKIVGYISDAEGNIIRYIYAEDLIVVPVAHIHLADSAISVDNLNVAKKIKDSLKAALAELKANDVQALVPAFGDFWKTVTGGAPFENIVVTDLFEVCIINRQTGEVVENGDVPEGCTLTFFLSVESLENESPFVLLHKPNKGTKWRLEDNVKNERGVLTVTVDSLSPFAIVQDSTVGPDVNDGPDSPQTGVVAVSAVVGIMLLAVGGVGVVVFRKKHA